MSIYNFYHKRPDAPELLKTRGMFVHVEIAIHPDAESAIIKKGASPRSPVACIGMVDTGALITAIDHKVASQLDLKPTNNVTLCTADGPTIAPRYPFQLKILPDMDFQVFGVGVDLRGQPAAALIGMDVLSRCLLIVNGKVGAFTISK